MKNFMFVLLFIMIIAGCSNEKIETTMENGILHINNPEYGIWHDEESKDFDFELLETFGEEDEPENEVLSAAGIVFTDYDLNVYIYDWRESRLIKFDKEGNFLWGKGRVGQGPGEFDHPQAFITDGYSSIYVSNQWGRKVDQFNLDGIFERTIDLSNVELSEMTLIGFTKPDIFIASVTNTGESGVHLYRIKFTQGGEVLEKIDVMEDVGIDLPLGLEMSQSVSFESNKVYLSAISKYAIDIYDDKLKLERTINRNFNKIVRPGVWTSGNSRSIWGYGSLEAPKTYLNKYFFVSATWPTNLADPDDHIVQSSNGNAPELEFKTSIDLFNLKGELLGSKVNEGQSPTIGKIRHIDAAGNIYTIVDEPFPQVRKYKVIIKEGV